MPRVTEVFGQSYADAYDSLYREKDYEGEVDLIERLLARNGIARPCRLLDLGCGTGNHALALARRGHDVVGVDRSPSMLGRARSKAAAAVPAERPQPVFWQSDIRDVEIGSRFDAVIMMFAVLCYVIEDRDVLATLGTVRRHLAPGGLFIFDVWNGPAVLADRPKSREVSLTDGATRIVRKTRTALDLPRHLCHVYFDLQRAEAGGSTEQSTEEHVVRFYFPQELETMLHQCGLSLIQLRSFPNEELPPDESAWNVIGIARAATHPPES
jgi:SAM-dependent methyltransferase